VFLSFLYLPSNQSFKHRHIPYPITTQIEVTGYLFEAVCVKLEMTFSGPDSPLLNEEYLGDEDSGADGRDGTRIAPCLQNSKLISIKILEACHTLVGFCRAYGVRYLSLVKILLSVPTQCGKHVPQSSSRRQ